MGAQVTCSLEGTLPKTHLRTAIESRYRFSTSSPSTSTKKKRRLCDLSEKRHRVFSSVASMASVVPLCRLCGKKALCTFLNEKKAKFYRGMYTVYFFYRGDTE